ncbi:aspartate--tRNA ligase [Roseburia sp. MUC/MUC-530-WT-4D]|uniref:Aspartate--tRNA ligase n=1 Tax=Roseburia porci TaxID=2605790 RepID=A0A6L5YNZ0_9FIRM|nr:aspartate--tRNA ligase [Roseburia porci]MDD6742877.1 aspartate--tRNA ligase [Roseburia porci]MST74110.1 aspartate--tRNA ligase [Roseburia porci]
MAESMRGLHRSHRCTEVSNSNIGEKVTVMGWVQKRRNLGSLIFVDLRDRSGILQLVFDEDSIGKEGFEKAGTLRSEYVIAVEGTVQKRSAAVNENLKTGDIEVIATSLRILSEAQTPPFQIEENSQTKDEIRLKYRYLDLRRPDIQRNLMLRSKVLYLMRDFMAKEGFLEIETPILCRSTPEGARDYLVPSRVHPGNFYALPQSPQLFKQLLMASGYDRYFQIARCFRDEDLRADRQPEFTQADMELSFVDMEDVLDVNERLLKYVFKEAINVDIQLPLPRMPWQEAMDRFGSDKPDTRFGMELQDVSDVVKGCGFSVFTSALEAGGSVRGINVEGQGAMPRKKIDKLVEFAKGYGAKGLAYLCVNEDGTYKSSFAKFMTEEELNALVSAMNGKPGDLLLFAADKNKIVWNVLGALRLKMGEELGLMDPDQYNFLWVTEFPLLEWSDEENRYMAMHHPFTMPMEEDWKNVDTDPGSVRAIAYDIVLNGTELGGGSVRIHQDDIQEKMFEVLGISKERAQEKFGYLLDAFSYGVPPHAGLAYGVDRMVMHMVHADTIRDVIAFPKVKDASDLMTATPNVVDEEQLEELGIAVIPQKEEDAE